MPSAKRAGRCKIYLCFLKENERAQIQKESLLLISCQLGVFSGLLVLQCILLLVVRRDVAMGLAGCLCVLEAAEVVHVVGVDERLACLVVVALLDHVVELHAVAAPDVRAPAVSVLVAHVVGHLFFGLEKKPI